jgi:hypothetical protein
MLKSIYYFQKKYVSSNTPDKEAFRLAKNVILEEGFDF